MFNFEHINKSSIIDTLNLTTVVLLYLLALLLPLIYAESLRDASSLPRYTVYGVSSGLILSLILINRFLEKKQAHLFQPLFIPVLVFLIWAWVSLSWSVDPKNALIELIQLSGCILVSYSISQINKNQIFILLIISSVAGASLAALIGILQYFNYNPFNYLQFAVPASTFTNPNFATIYIDLITPVAFSLILIAGKNSFKIMATVSSSLCLYFILISHSRGSWLALIFVLLGLFLLYYRNLNFKYKFVPIVKAHRYYLLVAIIIPFMLFFIPSNVTEAPVKKSQISFDGSAKIRLHAYINSLSILKDHPITGTGYGSFKTEFRSYMFSTVPFSKITEDNTLARLHSDPLQFFIELGFIGGLLFIYIYIILLQYCWKIIKTTSDTRLLIITSGIFLAIIANGIHASVDFPFHKPTSALQFWIWFGIIAAISTTSIPTKSITINKFSVILLIIFGFSFSIYNFKYYQDYIKASQYRLVAEKNIKEKDCNSAKRSADNMMGAFDADFRHQLLYVAIYSQCDFDDSEKLVAMNRILNYDQTNTRAYITRGTIYLQQKSTQNAMNDFLQVTRILPHRASGFIGLAYASLQNNNISSAIKLLKYALTVEPKNTFAKDLLDQINHHK